MFLSICAVAAFLLNIIFIPLLIRLCEKKKWFDPVSTRKVHKDQTPRLGSLTIVPVFWIITVLFLYYTDKDLLLRIVPVIAGSLIVFAAGILDDFIDLTPLVKFLAQCLAAIIPVVFGFHFTSLGNFSLWYFSKPLMFLWIVALTNAFNLIDGIDALCSSISLLVCASLAFLYFYGGSPDYAGIIIFLMACIAGFLVYNRPKAKIFLGDGGSQFLGFMISLFPCLMKGGNFYSFNIIPAMIVFVSIPVLDTISAIWRRLRDGHSFYNPDKKHIHHKLLQLSYSVRGILYSLLAIQVVLCILSIIVLLDIENIAGFLLLCGAFVAMVGYFCIIHYTYLAVNIRGGGKTRPLAEE